MVLDALYDGSSRQGGLELAMGAVGTTAGQRTAGMQKSDASRVLPTIQSAPPAPAGSKTVSAAPDGANILAWGAVTLLLLFGLVAIVKRSAWGQSWIQQRRWANGHPDEALRKANQAAWEEIERRRSAEAGSAAAIAAQERKPLFQRLKRQGQEPEKPPAPRVRFSDVEGQDEAKNMLRIVVEFLKNPERFRKLGAKGFRGCLLFGPPGTGKTLLADAIAGESGLRIIKTSGSDMIKLYVGTGPKAIREKFAEARASGGPAILFIDEIDAIGGKRKEGSNDEYANTLNALLYEMSHEQNANVFVIAATNRPDMLDPALVRARRFGLKIPVGLPDISGREKILRLHTKTMPLYSDVDLRKIAEQTPGASGADMAEIPNEAALLAGARGAEAVSAADFQQAVDNQVGAGRERRLIMSAREKEAVAYHESGHALLTLLLPNGDPITKITIIPHGLQALGHVMTVEQEERFMHSRSWLQDRIAILLGGRMAERMMTGEVYTGAQNDFEVASDLARRMVTKWGMSSKVGPISYDRTGDERKAGGSLSERENNLIDEEVRKIIKRAAKRARKLLSGHENELKILAQGLMNKETLRREDITRLLPDLKKLEN